MQKANNKYIFKDKIRFLLRVTKSETFPECLH